MITKLEGTRVLVTGGTGFIGSHLVRRLLAEKANVFVLARKQSHDYLIRDIKSKITLVQADIRDFSRLSRVVMKIKPQKIFHLAAYVNRSRSLDQVDKCMEVNFFGTVNLIRSLEDINYDCFINTGTCEEYGNAIPPFKEDQLIHPISAYSLSKSSSVLFCDMYHKNTGRPVLSIRPFTTYGPGQGFNMFVSQVIVSALQKKDFKMSKGEQTREFNYVADIVDGYIKASTTPRAVGEIINLGTGIEYSIKDVAAKIVAMMGSSIKIKFGALPYRTQEIWHLYSDNTKSMKLLNWKPKVNLTEGLKKTIKWFSENINSVYAEQQINSKENYEN